MIQFNKLKSVQFKTFTYGDFKLNKSETIKLKNGKSVSAEKFLSEVNEIERKLNEFGYSLRDRDDEIILGRLKYPYGHLQEQEISFNESAKYSARDNLRITPCGFVTESEIQSALKSGTPKESWPINKNKNWSVEFGDNNFDVEINSRINFSAEEKNSAMIVNSNSDVDVKVKILGERVPALKLIERVFNTPSQNDVILFLMNNKAVEDNLKSSSQKKYFRELNWESDLELSFGPFSVGGKLITNGETGLLKHFNPSNLKLNEELIPFIDLNLSGELNTDLIIAEAGIEGNLKIINDTLKIVRNVELKNSGSAEYFDYEIDAVNKLNALKGKIYAYVKIDYLLGSKKFILVLYDNPDGVSSEQKIMKEKFLQPSERDRELWLEINRITGITKYSARNEQLDVVPKAFIVEVEAAGQSFCDTIADWNNDGIIETPIKHKIPMLNSLSIPIKISVIEKYKIGDFSFDTYLDFVKGELSSIQICYDPVSRKISGDAEGKEEQELILTGDKNYFGERNHSIRFKLTPHLKFKEAPTKAR
ncbi:MAG: hypothetical protein AMXMBFR50_23890 [Ignavibacterium album]